MSDKIMDLCWQAAYSIGSLVESGALLSDDWAKAAAIEHGDSVLAALVCWFDSAKLAQFLALGGGDWTAWAAMMASFVA